MDKRNVLLVFLDVSTLVLGEFSRDFSDKETKTDNNPDNQIYQELWQCGTWKRIRQRNLENKLHILVNPFNFGQPTSQSEGFVYYKTGK